MFNKKIFYFLTFKNYEQKNVLNTCRLTVPAAHIHYTMHIIHYTRTCALLGPLGRVAEGCLDGQGGERLQEAHAYYQLYSHGAQQVRGVRT